MSSNLNVNAEKVRIAWGPDAPAWVGQLAAACDRSSQRIVADTLARSSGYISRLINNDYAGSLHEAETIVRAAFGGEDVACPAIGDTIPLAGCVRNRRRDGPPTTFLARLWATHCPRCPLNTDRQED